MNPRTSAGSPAARGIRKWLFPKGQKVAVLSRASLALRCVCQQHLLDAAALLEDGALFTLALTCGSQRGLNTRTSAPTSLPRTPITWLLPRFQNLLWSALCTPALGFLVLSSPALVAPQLPQPPVPRGRPGPAGRPWPPTCGRVPPSALLFLLQRTFPLWDPPCSSPCCVCRLFLH